MKKQTAYLIIGIGIASVLAGIYSGYRMGDYSESISGIVIGVALVGTVIIERSRKEKEE